VLLSLCCVDMFHIQCCYLRVLDAVNSLSYREEKFIVVLCFVLVTGLLLAVFRVPCRSLHAGGTEVD
jgi:hypothetical protein